MNRETRILKIQDIEKTDKPIGKIEIPWKDRLEPMDVYEIPLRFLVYNKYNGRILSRTKSYENQRQLIDAESTEGKELIEKLLWDSKPSKNKETLESLKKLKQEKVGIITKDGIIIDGNRRAMLLNKIDEIDYFKAVILPVEYAGNPIEIEKFETKYQLGEERKLDYNPIEIYLKIQRLYQQLSESNYPNEGDKKKGVRVDKKAIDLIYNWIGNYKNINSANDIEYSLQVMNLMDEYLEYQDYNGIYTALDEREEQFRGLTNWLNTFYGETSAKAFDGYKNSDVDELKSVAFDLIRMKFKNEKFRYLAQGQKQNHFFGTREIWSSFLSNHEKIISSFKEEQIDFNINNLEAHLNSRDTNLKNNIGDLIDENVDIHYQKLRNKQSQDEPVKLLNKAIDSLESININSKNFSKPDSLALTEKLADLVNNTLQKKSPKRLLSHIVKLLEEIDTEKIPEQEKEGAKLLTKTIQSLGYQIHKNL
ncbi:hypothetical protein HKT18_01720 [Flavobacterium sp. IMCC34852]|uniref:ParB/Sulfiredoxin domain-containing protein n=1 Tax=Flavobacterium rivulicola TaxID=2732161 RepID=A0A7Y3VXV0_9FLAO|nr:hypothetical protein [Flavobacterium sp. IMCC34852]NNT70922.1 hypothetical protein [Flavobacterium sp. IMCC34852]